MMISELPERIDLGDGRTMKWVTFEGEHVMAAIEEHPRARDVALQNGAIALKGEPCSGMMYLDVPELLEGWKGKVQTWTVQQWNPPTLSPSVLCTFCGNHGFIRDGKWVPA